MTRSNQTFIYIQKLSLLMAGMGAVLFVEAQENLATRADTIAYYRNTSQSISAINTESVEYAPSISADGRTMIVESNKGGGGGYKLYEFVKNSNGQWVEGNPLDNINNFGESNDLIGGPSISFDGNYLFFFASFKGGLGREDIFYSIREESGWSEPVNIGAPINTPAYEGFPSISADGKSLYFVRENLAGPWDKDLAKNFNDVCYSVYVATKERDGTWGTPVKLPFPINQDCEKAPRIMADNATLIFSSNRLGGAGNYDLYQTQQNQLGDWSNPVPLDFVNSDKADQFSCISAEGDLMYFTYNNADIYSVLIPPSLRQFRNVVITGYVRDRDKQQGQAAKIQVTNANTSEQLFEIDNNPNDGRYTLVLAAGNAYNVEVSREGYSSYSTSFDLTGVQEYQELSQDIDLFTSARLELNIYDVEIFEPLKAKIKVKIEGERSLLLDVENNPATGKIELDLPLGQTYEVIIDADNFKSEYFVFDVSDLVIYREYNRDLEMVPIKKDVVINVADLVNNGKIRSRVKVVNKNRDETIEVEGNQSVALRVGDRYEVEATSDQGYAFSTTVIDVTEDLGDVGGPEVKVDIKLQPLVKGANLPLKDILFESNSATMDEISFQELSRVFRMMEDNPSLKVEIAAHTDDVGSDSYNQLLSERRAQSVVSYLIENRIPNERFVYRGYGESQPLVPNDTEENKARNRRVVLKVLEI